MAIIDDIDFDLVNKIIHRKSGCSDDIHTANALYSYIQDSFDELALMDDTVPQSGATPTSYSMINGWYIQEQLTHYLKGGAIQTSGYLDEIRTLICGATGWTNFVAGDIGRVVQGQTTMHEGYLLDYDNTAHKLWIRMSGSTDIFDDATEDYECMGGTGDGTATAISTTGETIFANPYTLGTLEGAPQLYIYQDGAKVTGWWGTGHIDILIKVKETGADIDSRKITVFGRTWTDLYTGFPITLTTAGQNAVPLGSSDDLNNQSTTGDVAIIEATMAIDFGFTTPHSYDIGDGNGAQDYEVQIDCAGNRLSDVYEVCKYWTREGSTEQLETNADGSFINGEAYRYANDTYAEVVVSPFGTFAGGKFFGARSVYFINLHAEDVQAFQLVDKAGVTRYPPNFQSFAVTAVVAGDRVTIFPEAGGLVNKSQYNIKAAQGAGVLYVDIDEAIPADTPATGFVIVRESTTGAEEILAYTSWSGDRFVVSATAAAYGVADTVYVPYIYEEATTTSVSEAVIYVADKDIIIRVRRKGILPFETLGTFGATGYSVAAQRTPDNIVI